MKTATVIIDINEKSGKAQIRLEQNGHSLSKNEVVLQAVKRVCEKFNIEMKDDMVFEYEFSNRQVKDMLEIQDAECLHYVYCAIGGQNIDVYKGADGKFFIGLIDGDEYSVTRLSKDDYDTLHDEITEFNANDARRAEYLLKYL